MILFYIELDNFIVQIASSNNNYKNKKMGCFYWSLYLFNTKVTRMFFQCKYISLA